MSGKPTSLQRKPFVPESHYRCGVPLSVHLKPIVIDFGERTLFFRETANKFTEDGHSEDTHKAHTGSAAGESHISTRRGARVTWPFRCPISLALSKASLCRGSGVGRAAALARSPLSRCIPPVAPPFFIPFAVPSLPIDCSKEAPPFKFKCNRVFQFQQNLVQHSPTIIALAKETSKTCEDVFTFLLLY